MIATLKGALDRHLRLHSFPRLLVGSIVFSAVLLLGSAAILRRSWSANMEAAQDVARSYETLVALKDVLAEIISVTEMGEHGLLFGITDASMQPYAVRRARVRHGMDKLEQLCSDDPAELQRIVELDRRVENRLAEIDRVLQLEQEGRHEVALATMQGVLRAAEMLQIRAHIRNVQDEEVRHLAARREALASVKAWEVHLALGILAAEGFFVGFTVFLVRRVLALRRLVTVCAWSKQIKVDGQWITLEQYLGDELNLHLTHGISPEMAQKWETDFEAQAKLHPVDR
jgi:CHASE3 domain sensor protein